MGVADFFGKKEQEAAGDKDDGKKVGTEPEEKKEDAAEVGAGWADEVGFGVLRGLGVKGEVAWIKGKEGEKQEDTRAKNGECDDFLAEGGTSAGRFRFGHKGAKESN